MQDVPSSRATRLGAPLDVCRFVDEIPDGVGELVVEHGGVVRGSIYIQSGRICWIAAKGLDRRLTQLLAERAGVNPHEMERHFVRCRNAKVPLGEDLVARKLVSATDLRRALLDHSAESLTVLCKEEAVGRWRPQRGGYSARFVFTTAEIAGHAYAVEAPAAAAAAAGVLECHFDASHGDWGAAFVREGGRAQPLLVAVFGAYPASATELSNDADSVLSALDILSTVGRNDLLLVADDERVRCAFLEERRLHLGCTDREGALRILAYRRRRARTYEEAAQ